MNEPTAEGIRAQLERLVNSQSLAGSDQLKRLLRVIVERSIEGNSGLLKEYSLGLEVFQRPPDYDPKVDPIVRVQARRLRSKLDEHYAGEGSTDPVLVQIPKGAYVPTFAAKAPIETARPPSRRGMWLTGLAASILLAVFLVLRTSPGGAKAATDLDRSLAVLPLANFTGDNTRAHLPEQATEVLTTELAKNKQLRVLSRTTANTHRNTTSTLPQVAKALGVRWVVEGGLGVESGRIYVKLRAVDSRADRKIWADVFDCEIADLVSVNARAAANIAAAIEAELRRPPQLE